MRFDGLLGVMRKDENLEFWECARWEAAREDIGPSEAPLLLEEIKSFVVHRGDRPHGLYRMLKGDRSWVQYEHTPEPPFSF